MEINYIIVQAGGRGSRLGHLTDHRPKALVPVENLPILFHLFQKYPDKKYVIIGDYQENVLRKYLAAFAHVTYLIVSAKGKSGTCAGIRDALKKIPAQEAFMLLWSDLMLPEQFELPREDGNYAGITRDFLCRWSYREGKFEETPSQNAGVAGLFLFQNKLLLQDVPDEGEFVRWMKETAMTPRTLYIDGAREYGLLETVKMPESGRCRPFNRITEKDGLLYKEGIDEQGKKLAFYEREWYRFAKQAGLKNIPEIYAYEPALVMEKIQGKSIFACTLSLEEKRAVLRKLVECFKNMHTYGRTEPDYFSVQKAYAGKTLQRLHQVRELIPYADEPFLTVNGRKCRNVLRHMERLQRRVEQLRCDTFCLIHGDCTFSNIILKDGKTPVLIDPRGYFGDTQIYGDPLYDWAKLYYSLYGNYDQFNLRRFSLQFQEAEITLKISSGGWEALEKEYFDLVRDAADKEEIRLIHAIIWLSLTTYAWEDYDSICGAFYNGLYYLEEVL